MATLTCNFQLTYNQRGITAAQIVAVFTWLLNVQTAAAKVTGYVANVSVGNINDDIGTVTATVILTCTQTAAFAATDITNIQSWIQTNIIAALPAGVSLQKSYSWTQT